MIFINKKLLKWSFFYNGLPPWLINKREAFSLDFCSAKLSDEFPLLFRKIIAFDLLFKIETMHSNKCVNVGETNQMSNTIQCCLKLTSSSHSRRDLIVKKTPFPRKIIVSLLQIIFTRGYKTDLFLFFSIWLVYYLNKSLHNNQRM